MSTESPDLQRSSLGNFQGEFKSPDYIIFMVSLVVSLVIGKQLNSLNRSIILYLTEYPLQINGLSGRLISHIWPIIIWLLCLWSWV